MSARLTSFSLLGLLLAVWVGRAEPPAAPDPAHAFFATPVHRFDLELEPAAWDALRREPRARVRARVTVDGVSLPDVAVRIKGSAGSRRSIDDRPALTLDFNRHVPGREHAGLVKLHLNNSVQDRSRMNEWLGSLVFRRAGIPTARVTHALVRLNRQDLGVYVVKEGYDRRFVRRHFGDPRGNLYDGGFLRDIDQDLDRDAGPDPWDPADIRRLRDACAVEDDGERLEALGRVLDIDHFLTFAALEVMLEHWDGYCLHSNNYRLYHDPGTGRFRFVPHGMDQLLGRASMPVNPGFRGRVAQALFAVPGQRDRLRERMTELLGRVFDPGVLSSDLDRAWAGVRPALAGRPRQEVWDIEEEVAYLRDGIAARAADLRRQLGVTP